MEVLLLISNMDIFRYKSKTPLSLNLSIGEPEEIDAIRIPLADSKVIIYDSYRQLDGESVRDGLIFDIFGEEIQQEKATDLANLFACILSFSSKTEVPRPKLVQKIKSEDGASTFEQRYALKEGINQSMPPQLSEVEEDLSKALTYKVLDASEEDEVFYKELRRALRYYRKSLTKIQIEDQFTDLFIALDALRSRLYDHYISENNPDEDEDDDWYGVRKFFDEELNHDFDNGVYTARCKLFHDGKTEEAVEQVNLLEEAVEKAFFVILGMKFDQYGERMDREAKRVGEEPALFLRGEIENYSIPDSEVNLELPRFDTSQIDLDLVSFRGENEILGVKIEHELGDFIELDSDGYKELEKGFGARGAGPEGTMEDLP